MYYSYVEIEYVATSFSPARMDLALKLLMSHAKWDVLSSYVKQNLEFQISESEFWFDDFSTAKLKNKSTGRSGIKNGIEILLPMGVPEIGTQNLEFPTKPCWRTLSCSGLWPNVGKRYTPHQRTLSHSRFWPNVAQKYAPCQKTLSRSGLWPNVAQKYAPCWRTLSHSRGTNKQMLSSALIQYIAAVKASFPASCVHPDILTYTLVDE